MDEPCKHVRINISDALKLEETAAKPAIHQCNLKRQSEFRRLEIYQRLSEKGLEHDVISDFCPLARDEIWLECPFYEPR